MAHIARPQLRLRETIALFAVLAIITGCTPSAAPEPRSDSSAVGAPTAAGTGPAEKYAAVLSLQETIRAASLYPSATGAADPNPGARRRPFLIQESPKDPPPAKEKVKAPPKPASPKPAPSSSTSTHHKRVFSGTNHFWIPSLGMSYGVRWYACGRTTTPLNYIYRWGCAGKNNVYLLGHAWGVMKPLHDLYVRGGLRVGMVAVYADASGHVRKYRVTEWRVVRPTEIAWQIAAQPVPSLTLQTCLGKNSEWRLNVRLVAVN